MSSSKQDTLAFITAKRTGTNREAAFVWLCRFAMALPLAVLAVLVVDVAVDGVQRLDWKFVKSFPSYRAVRAGIWPALVGTIYLMCITMVLALPVGVGAAVYLEEYGRRSKFAGFLEVIIANLAGVPSVIYGLLGLELFVRVFGFGASLLAGGCTLALLILPIVIMSTREALRTVPDTLREGSLALGATQWQTIRRVVLPMSLPGILTGSILAISRAIGETAPLILVGAVVFINFLPDGIDAPFTALPIQIFNWVGMPQTAFLQNAAAGIVVLLMLLLVFNSVAIYLRHKYQKRN